MRIKTQVLTVKVDPKGRHYWHSDVAWWVPHTSIELTAKSFPAGTRITVREPVVGELRKQVEGGKK